MALPFPSTHGQQMLAMGTQHWQGDRRHEGARVEVPSRHSPALQRALEEARLFVRSIEEQARRRVAVIRGDDKPPTRREPFDEISKVVAGQLAGDFARQRVEAGASAGSIILKAAVGAEFSFRLRPLQFQVASAWFQTRRSAQGTAFEEGLE
ncbi:MAG: hypothetical protein WA826_17535, partial [Silvibacterium sp.]